MPTMDIDRATYAALLLAGKAGEQPELGRADGPFTGQSVKGVAPLEGAIRKARKGREVLVSLPLAAAPWPIAGNT